MSKPETSTPENLTDDEIRALHATVNAEHQRICERALSTSACADAVHDRARRDVCEAINARRLLAYWAEEGI